MEILLMGIFTLTCESLIYFFGGIERGTAHTKNSKVSALAPAGANMTTLAPF